ncbi:hypothetical protein KOM07_05190 [Lentilactobacillus sp. G22-6]|uniref:hypothetical protein n=1 Tax=Lentilactobacillus dabitei TaxID=2831523 RepID=UPI001C26B7AC|nr:hypothetical protein [Lentilactobacillus dabitei]MBU9788933.1 hypothetical protein [Lentilactobacillus dabitei]
MGLGGDHINKVEITADEHKTVLTSNGASDVQIIDMLLDSIVTIARADEMPSQLIFKALSMDFDDESTISTVKRDDQDGH